MVVSGHPGRAGGFDEGWLGDRRARGPLLNLVEFQISTAAQQHPGAIQTPSDHDLFATVRQLSLGPRDLKEPAVPCDRPVVLHGALLFENEHVLEAQAPGNGSVVVDRARCAVPELFIDRLDETFPQKRVGRGEILDAPQPQLLDETVLQHAVPPLDPALGLRGWRPE